MAKAVPLLLLGLLAGLALSLALNALAFGAAHYGEALAALGVTATHGFLVFLVLGHGSRTKKANFLSRGLGIHIVRVVLVVASVLLARALGRGELLPFILAVMVGYLCVLTAEVASLHLGNRLTDSNAQ